MSFHDFNLMIDVALFFAALLIIVNNKKSGFVLALLSINAGLGLIASIYS